MRLRTLETLSVLSVFSVGMFAEYCHGQGSQFGQGGSSMSRGGIGSSGGGRGQSRGGASFGNNTFGASRGGMGGAGFGSGYGTGGFAGGQGMQQGGIGNTQPGIAPNAGFIGGAQDMQNFFRSLNGQRQRTASFNPMIENLNEMREPQGNDGSDRSPPVRVQLRPAFETPLGTIARVNADVQSRVIATATDIGVTNPQIRIDGRKLTLEGRVKTAHDRELVEKLISLEPGVTEIDNRLMVDLATPPQ